MLKFTGLIYCEKRANLAVHTLWDDIKSAFGYTAQYTTSLGLLVTMEVFFGCNAMQAHIPLVLDAGTVSVSVPPLICAGLVYCHCTGRWAVLDNTHGKDSGAIR